jgi:hypothetical protein
MFRQGFPCVLLCTLLALSASCKKRDTATSTTPETAADRGCEHDTELNLAFPKTWPYPADDRQLRWRGPSMRVELQVKPRNSAPVTGSSRWKDGEGMEIVDSQIVVHKARRVVAKRDLTVSREVWDQGRKIVQSMLAVEAGATVEFLLYDSRGTCLIMTPQGLASVSCNLQDTFDTVTPDNPYACEETWWLKVDQGKMTRGWFKFDPKRMERVSAK